MLSTLRVQRSVRVLNVVRQTETGPVHRMIDFHAIQLIQVTKYMVQLKKYLLRGQKMQVSV